jgi:hypothetical protein
LGFAETGFARAKEAVFPVFAAAADISRGILFFRVRPEGWI